MGAPAWQVTGVILREIAGYSEIVWEGIQKDLNLLVGRNGCGKSSVLQALAMALNFFFGRRGEDLLTGAYESASITLRRSDGSVQELSFREVRTVQTAPASRPVREVLYLVESRRPKSRIGRGRSQLTQHPSVRYDYVMSELQAVLRDRQGEGRLAERIIELAQEMGAGSPGDWEWILQMLQRGGPRAIRPMSCGQYDMLAIILDLVRMAEARTAPSDPVFIIIDNPDAFLHPAVQGNLISLIPRVLPGVQIFLATHSLKLLARREPRSVFWLSRERACSDRRVRVNSMRELDAEGSRLFYELYGTDASTAVLDLVMGLDATEYLKFLCECSLPCRLIVRERLKDDPQMQVIVDNMLEFDGPWALLDYGAGAGDLLMAGLRLGLRNPQWEYVAVQPEPSELLVQRVDTAKGQGAISTVSRISSELSNVAGKFDAVVLCNTCHAIAFSELPVLLGQLLEYLRLAPTSRLVIHEMELLRRGERDFIMWTPSDYTAVFRDVPGVRVEVRCDHRPDHVPLHTTLLWRVMGESLPADLSELVAAAFRALLPNKLRDCVRGRNELRANRRGEGGDMAAHLEQRRDAFLSEQIANIVTILAQTTDFNGVAV